MAENFYTILTNTGKAKLANAQALGTTVQFSSIAVGDGAGNYYEPAESQAALKNEVWRGPINQIKTDSENPNWIIVEVVVPTTTGGFTVREAGIIDSEGDLIALGKYPATYKPALAEGSGKDLYIRMILEVSNASTIMLKIDPAIVLSTRGYVDDSIAEHNTAPLAHGNLPYQKTSQKDQPGGYVGLDAERKINKDRLPDGTGIPVGFIGIFLAETPPAGWLECNGSLVSRETYPELWAYAQSSGNILAEDTTANEGHFTVGNGLTTFRLPNPQGTFFRVLDKTRGVDPDSGRAVGSEQMDAMQGHWHSRHGATTGSEPGPSGNNSNGTFVDYPFVGDPITDGEHGEPRIASETRSHNTAILCCIKAFDGATNQGLIDITALANQLNNKVDKVDIKAPGDAPMYVCRAWSVFTGVSPTILAEGNVSSVTKNGTGDYTVNFVTAMPDTNYIVSVEAGRYDNLFQAKNIVVINTKTVKSTRFTIGRTDYTNGGSIKEDATLLHFAVIR